MFKTLSVTNTFQIPVTIEINRKSVTENPKDENSYLVIDQR